MAWEQERRFDRSQRIVGCERRFHHNEWQKKKPIKSHDIPSIPWQKVASDIFTINGKNYLLVVDYRYYSHFVELALLNDTRSSTIVTHFKSIFSRHGIPQTLITDNGPNHVSREFKQFTSSWEIEHITSSPRYPQSNGLAERMVQTVKNLISKAGDTDPYLALLNLRAAPLKNLPSPAELLMGRKLKTKLLIASKLLRPKKQSPAVIKNTMRKSQADQQKYYNRGTIENRRDSLREES
ncbi:Pol polyprotein [Plakobranchus ocellatus]|uniref:Pol polyprotein n=1 Tax=Plakobranchus ocellatus TaxID=259542 RepID=A0AAV4DL47_9GAST|nr:Pol polyprotein [Plakobranchus ocellatus]